MSISTLFLDGDNKQLRDAIFKATPKAVEQCKIIAQKFRGKDDLQTCQNIWNFLKNDVTYVVDGEHQKIKLPSALLRERVGDCKSYSLFTAGILGNLGIPFKYALTSYTSDPTPAHIYVKCDNGIIIDAVWTAFNQEKKPNHIYYQKPNMKISYIAGINAPVQKSRQSISMGCCCDTKGVTGLGGMPCGSKRISGLPIGAYRKPLGTTMDLQFAGIGRTGTDWAKAIGREQGTYDTLAYYTKAGSLYVPRMVILALIRNNGGGIANFLYNAWLRTEPYYLPNQKKYDAEYLAQNKALLALPKYNLVNKEFVFNDAEKKLLGSSLITQANVTYQTLTFNTFNNAKIPSNLTPPKLPPTIKQALTPLRYAAYLDYNAAAKKQKDAYLIDVAKFNTSLNEKYPEKTRVIQPSTDKSKAKYRDLEWWFFKQGGSPDDFNNAVKEGNGKSPRGKDANYMLNKAYNGNLGVKDIGLITRAIVSVYGGDKFGLGDNGTFVIGIGCADVITCTAAVTAYVVPITEGILAISSLLSAVGIDLTEVVTGDKAKAEKEAKDKAEKEAAAAEAEARKKKEEDDAKTSKKNTTLIVGGISVALVGAYFLLKK